MRSNTAVIGTRRDIVLSNSRNESFSSHVDLMKASSSSWSSQDSSSSLSDEPPLGALASEGVSCLVTTTKSASTTASMDVSSGQFDSAILNANDPTQHFLVGPRPVLLEDSPEQHNPPPRPSHSRQRLELENERLRDELNRLRSEMNRLKRGAVEHQQSQSDQRFSLRPSPPVSCNVGGGFGALLELPLSFRQGQQPHYGSDSETVHKGLGGTNLLCFKDRSQKKQSLLQHTGVSRDQKDHQSVCDSDDDQDTIESRIVDIDAYQSASGLIRRSQSHVNGGNKYDLVGTDKSTVQNSSVEHIHYKTPVKKRRTDVMTEDTLSSTDDASEDDGGTMLTSDEISLDDSLVESQRFRPGGPHSRHKTRNTWRSKSARGGIVVAQGGPMAKLATSTGEHALLNLPGEMSFCRSVVDRAGWLVGLLVFQSLSSFILARNESLLKHHTVIVQFLTMLVGAGGNAGNQASVGVVRGLAVGTIDRSNVRQFLMRELSMGVALSLILGVSGFVRAAVFSVPRLETIAITSSLFLIVIISVVAGATLPLGMHMVGIDPAHSSTTIQVIMDITGVVITVGVSSWVLDSDFLHQLHSLLLLLDGAA
jgi:hypothetical protein